MNQRRGMVCLAVKQNLLKRQWKWQHQNFFSHNLICFISLLQSWTQIFLCREVGNAYSSLHSNGMCRMWRFLAVLRSFFHSCPLYTLSCHPSPPTILPSSLTSSCHLFLGLPLNLIVSKYIYNTLLGVLFYSILCSCTNQRDLFNLIVSVIMGFLILWETRNHGFFCLDGGLACRKTFILNGQDI